MSRYIYRIVQQYTDDGIILLSQNYIPTQIHNQLAKQIVKNVSIVLAIFKVGKKRCFSVSGEE